MATLNQNRLTNCAEFFECAMSDVFIIRSNYRRQGLAFISDGVVDRRQVIWVAPDRRLPAADCTIKAGSPA